MAYKIIMLSQPVGLPFYLDICTQFPGFLDSAPSLWYNTLVSIGVWRELKHSFLFAKCQFAFLADGTFLFLPTSKAQAGFLREAGFSIAGDPRKGVNMKINLHDVSGLAERGCL